MTTTPLTDEREQQIRAEFQLAADGMPAWMVRSAPIGALLAEIDRLRAELATALTLTRPDLKELHGLLTADRYRMDKGNDRPVPQPRWEINVRITQAIQRALDAAASAGSGADQ